MKKLLILMLAILPLISCSKKDEPEPPKASRYCEYTITYLGGLDFSTYLTAIELDKDDNVRSRNREQYEEGQSRTYKCEQNSRRLVVMIEVISPVTYNFVRVGYLKQIFYLPEKGSVDIEVGPDSEIVTDYSF